MLIRGRCSFQNLKILFFFLFKISGYKQRVVDEKENKLSYLELDVKNLLMKKKTIEFK